jgi:hypothetical protein
VKKVENKRSKGALALRITAALASAILLMAGLLFLWAWISYRVRFSAEVVRAGLLFVYIIPVLFAVKIIKT